MIYDLDHVNIVTSSFTETVSFYETKLGLVSRPGVSSVNRTENSWLETQQGVVVIHVNGPLDSTAPPAGATGRLDHFALRCHDLAGMTQRLETSGTTFEQRRIAARAMTQLILYDPNGIKVELTFIDGDGPMLS